MSTLTRIEIPSEGITGGSGELPLSQFRFQPTPLAQVLETATEIHKIRMEQAFRVTAAKEHAIALSDIWAVRQDLDNQILRGEIQDFETYRQKAREQFGEIIKRLPVAVQSDPQFIQQSTAIESSALNSASEQFATREIKNSTARAIAGIETMIQNATAETSREIIQTADRAIDSLVNLDESQKIKFKEEARNGLYSRLVREDLYDRKIPATEVEARLRDWYELTGSARERALNEIRDAKEREEREESYQKSVLVYQRWDSGQITEKDFWESAVQESFLPARPFLSSNAAGGKKKPPRNSVYG